MLDLPEVHSSQVQLEGITVSPGHEHRWGCSGWTVRLDDPAQLCDEGANGPHSAGGGVLPQLVDHPVRRYRPAVSGHQETQYFTMSCF